MNTHNTVGTDKDSDPVLLIADLVSWVEDLVEDLIESTERMWLMNPHGDSQSAHMMALAVQRDLRSLHRALKSHTSR